MANMKCVAAQSRNPSVNLPNGLRGIVCRVHIVVSVCGRGRRLGHERRWPGVGRLSASSGRGCGHRPPIPPVMSGVVEQPCSPAHNRIYLPRDMFDEPLPQADPDVLMQRNGQRRGITALVAATVLRDSGCFPTLPEVAAEQEVSTRLGYTARRHTPVWRGVQRVCAAGGRSRSPPYVFRVGVRAARKMWVSLVAMARFRRVVGPRGCGRTGLCDPRSGGWRR